MSDLLNAAECVLAPANGADGFVSGTGAASVPSAALTVGKQATLINGGTTVIAVKFHSTGSAAATANNLNFAVGARFDWVVETGTTFVNVIAQAGAGNAIECWVFNSSRDCPSSL